MAARYGLRSKQARLHASAADRSWQQAPGIPQVADFGVLPPALLQLILAQVPFNPKRKCEAVCRAWRKVLRCGACPDTTTSSSSAGGVWGHLDLYLDVHAERPDFSKASPCRIHSYGPYETNLCNSEALDPDMSPEADFVEWLRLRAPAADKITIANTSVYGVQGPTICCSPSNFVSCWQLLSQNGVLQTMLQESLCNCMAFGT